MNNNIEEFDKFGYVLIKNLIAIDDINILKNYQNDEFPDYETGKRDSGLSRNINLYQSAFFDKEKKLRFDGIPLEHRLYRGQGSPNLQDTPNVYYGKRASKRFIDIPTHLDKHIFSNPFIGSVKEVLKCSELAFLQCSMNRTFPRYPGEAKKLHIDTYGFTYGDQKILDDTKYFINAIIYLDGTTEGRSPTKIISGSHAKYNEFNTIAAKALNKSKSQNCIHQRELYEELLPKQNYSIEEVESDPGDVLLFHCGLIHSIPENKSNNKTRNVIICNFADVGGYSFGKTRPNKEISYLKSRLSNLGLTISARSNTIIYNKVARKIKSSWNYIKNLRFSALDKFNNKKYTLNQHNRKNLLNEMPYLNLGSGPKWNDRLTIGLDVNGEGEDIGYFKKRMCDIDFDLGSFKPLPFENERFEGIYTSHCLEHLREKSVSHILKDCNRILKTKGCIRITLPNLSLYFDRYDKRDLGFFSWIKGKGVYQYDSWLRFICREFCGNIVDNYDDDQLYSMYEEMGRKEFILFLTKEANECNEVNRNIPGVHKSYWDPNKLIDLLRQVGFSEAYETERFKSKINYFEDKKNNQFNSTRPPISLFVEGIK